METLEYRTLDKSAWGHGAWSAEPDKRQWRDEATGLPCLIVRGPTGALCGYVGVSFEHPAHGLSYDHSTYDYETGKTIEIEPVKAAINEISVHGGLTYADGCGHGDQATTICHIPSPGEADDVWWFGFDCAHAGDYSPKYDRGFTGRGDVYRSIGYVTAEVTQLAKQLAALT